MWPSSYFCAAFWAPPFYERATSAPTSGASFFNARFFQPRFFNPRYFDQPAVTPTPSGGGGAPGGWGRVESVPWDYLLQARRMAMAKKQHRKRQQDILLASMWLRGRR